MMAHLSQLVLAVFLFAFVIYVARLRTVLLDRLAYIACALFGVILVVDPELTTAIARRLGIGRGTDLLLYLFIIASLFYAASVTSDLKRIQRQLTDLVRDHALANPRQGPRATAHRSRPAG